MDTRHFHISASFLLGRVLLCTEYVWRASLFPLQSLSLIPLSKAKQNRKKLQDKHFCSLFPVSRLLLANIVQKFFRLPLQIYSPPFSILLHTSGGCCLWTASGSPHTLWFSAGFSQKEALAGEQRVRRKRVFNFMTLSWQVSCSSCK